MNLKQLREKHPILTYKGFKKKYLKEGLKLTFNFHLEPDVDFQPSITIYDLKPEDLAGLDQTTLDRLFFHLGLAEIPSYWKASCSPEIVIENNDLTQDQLAWWEDLLIKGMGEFYYVNKIDFSKKNFVKVVNKNKAQTPITKTIAKAPILPTHSIPYLVPVGGGKDSALTLGILDGNKIDYACLLLEPLSPAAEKIVKISNSQKLIKVKRTIDPKLLDLNKKGYLNGHTPFSAYLAFLSSAVAYIYSYQQILVANEQSANEENIIFHGQTVNHQYSKTFEFENKFRDYAKKYLFSTGSNEPTQQNSMACFHCPHFRACLKTKDLDQYPKYVSFLRPIYEIQIAKLFTKYPKYHAIFKSCNVGQKKEIWCHQCPKCLFVFIMLSPFIDIKTLSKKIFQSNLFKNESLLETTMDLIGKGKLKPFECVGTHEETLCALYLSIQKYKAENQELPYILEQIEEKVLKNAQDLETRTEKLLNYWNYEHNLNSELEKILKRELEEAVVSPG